MSNKVHEKQLAKYQGNVYLSMLEVLARGLGVSVESLERLELGWAPIVNFKKGSNFDGWWVIPERDPYGIPVGLSLRNHGGFKCMMPGSNHGLVYPVNPHHERGQAAYRHGAHNWVRVADEGIVCPICNKPDGCLVSSENPADPKAVICIRQTENAAKPMKFGWLHIRKEEGKTTGISVLEESAHPILIVEGMTDVAAALDLGFLAVGRPSNLAGLDLLKDIVRGRDVVVFGENDDVNPMTGKKPGEEGMVAAFQFIKDVTKSCRQVLPPSHVKDLRSWCQSESLNREMVLKHIDEHARESQELKILPDRKPVTYATAFLQSTYRMDGRYTLRYRKKDYFLYDGTRYKEVDEDVFVRGPIYRWAHDKYVQRVTAKGEEVLDEVICNRGLVGDIIDAFTDPTLCPVSAEDIPCWLNGASGPPAQDIIPMENGLLYVPAWLEGGQEKDYLLPRTPDFFSTFSLPYPFDPTAEAPDLVPWLRSTFASDYDSRDLFQEWGGYNLVPHNIYQKMMIFRGPRRSGKGTAQDMIRSVVGREQCAAPSLDSLTHQFGLEELLHKRAWLMGDVRVSAKQDTVRAMEVLLNAAGDDEISVARKFKGAINTKVPAKITMATNELPAMPDHSGAMQARLLILNFNQSFYGREDFDLKRRLVKQAPGTLLWFLKGLKRLRENGGFTIPSATKQSLEDFRTTTSPTASFLEECCEQHPHHEINKTEMYDAWIAWSQERGMRHMGKGRFSERLRQNATYLHSESYTKGGHKMTVFKGIKLQPWAERNLLGKP